MICRERFSCWSILSVATRGVSYLWRGLANTSWVCLYNRPPVFSRLLTGEEPQLAAFLQCTGAGETYKKVCAATEVRHLRVRQGRPALPYARIPDLIRDRRHRSGRERDGK